MNQLRARLEPWAPTMLSVGLLATLAESLQERDITSIVLILISLLGAALVIRQRRGLTRGEVRAEVAAGVRGMVKDEARISPVYSYAHVGPGLARANLVVRYDELETSRGEWLGGNIVDPDDDSTLTIPVTPKEDHHDR